jgi:radical SAM-linked protein
MRLRLTFAKQGALRYTGQIDLHKIWERSVRRAGLPLAYSHGFHPKPKIQLAAALPLGFSSRCEVVDLRLERDLPLEGLAERIQLAVPPGLQILDSEGVDEQGPALQTLVESAEYEVTLLEEIGRDALALKIAVLLSAPFLPRERRGKPYDLRPLIEQLSPLPPGEGPGVTVLMRLAAREGATGRPDEILAELGIPLEDTRMERTRLIFKESQP